MEPKLELKVVEIDNMTNVYRLFELTGELVRRSSLSEFNEILDLIDSKKEQENWDVNRISLIPDEGKWFLELRSVTNESGPISIGGSTL